MIELMLRVCKIGENIVTATDQNLIQNTFAY